MRDSNQKAISLCLMLCGIVNNDILVEECFPYWPDSDEIKAKSGLLPLILASIDDKQRTQMASFTDKLLTFCFENYENDEETNKALLKLIVEQMRSITRENKASSLNHQPLMYAFSEILNVSFLSEDINRVQPFSMKPPIIRIVPYYSEKASWTLFSPFKENDVAFFEDYQLRFIWNYLIRRFATNFTLSKLVDTEFVTWIELKRNIVTSLEDVFKNLPKTPVEIINSFYKAVLIKPVLSPRFPDKPIFNREFKGTPLESALKDIKLYCKQWIPSEDKIATKDTKDKKVEKPIEPIVPVASNPKGERSPNRERWKARADARADFRIFPPASPKVPVQYAVSPMVPPSSSSDSEPLPPLTKATSTEPGIPVPDMKHPLSTEPASTAVPTDPLSVSGASDSVGLTPLSPPSPLSSPKQDRPGKKLPKNEKTSTEGHFTREHNEVDEAGTLVDLGDENDIDGKFLIF